MSDLIIQYWPQFVVYTFSRVSGYFRPVNQWNAGKREEFNDRRYARMNVD